MDRLTKEKRILTIDNDMFKTCSQETEFMKQEISQLHLDKQKLLIENDRLKYLNQNDISQ